eukprot:GSMAST32.ASY1.ANO1.1995.1 assembled CDS
MEFDDDIAKCFGMGDGNENENEQKIFVISSSELSSLSRERDQRLVQIVDRMGQASAVAQRLGGAITTFEKMIHANHRLYMVSQGSRCQGFLKMGKKVLFIHNNRGILHELEPLCVLDFYIHHSEQRKGIGRKLFDFMLKNEASKPHLLAYDRPSSKLLGFLSKYFNLRNFVKQNNNYVVYDEYVCFIFFNLDFFSYEILYLTNLSFFF